MNVPPTLEESGAPTYSTQHPHEPEIPPAIDDEGRCLVCSILVERDALRETLRGIARDFDMTEVTRVRNGEPRNYVAERLAAKARIYLERHP